MKLGRIFGELQRRRVLRVVGAYAVAAWVAVEVYTTIQPILWENHEWTNRLVVILALAGFPIVFALAWIFDITPAGVVRTAALPDDAPAPGVHVPARHRVMSPRAAGFFGLGILVALGSFAAYAGIHHEAPAAASVLAGDAPIESIAVLPFADMSAARDQEYFSDGMAEEILTRLSQVDGLRVAARTSAFAFKGRNDDVREIGRRLGVQTVLEGSVRRENDALRVTAKLIDVATGYQIWSARFDGDASDVFALQDEIANGVVDALRQRFAVAPEAGRRGTDNMRAYELYLLGLKRWNQRTERDLQQALSYFTESLMEDPAFAAAHAGLAQTYAVLPVYGAFPVDSAAAKGSAAAARAIAIDPSLAEAYAAMGQIVQNFDWDLRDAENYYQRALQYQPSYATAHQWYAETLTLLGRYDEADVHVQQVLASDPLSPTALYIGAFLETARGRAAALQQWRDLVRLHPHYELGLLHYALAALTYGRTQEATTPLAELAALRPAHAALYRSIAAALTEHARRPDAVAALRATRELPASERAAWFMALGERQQALSALERGFTLHDDANLLFIFVHPLLAPLRSEATWQAIAGNLHLGVAAPVRGA
jgi:adenylate cyclase